MAHVYSPDGSYLALCGEDGKLKIFDTTSNVLKQEYIPNLHLASPRSAITWIKTSVQERSASTSNRKKRRRKSISEDVDAKYFIAMGSVNGMISLYDVSTASVCSQLENGHTSVVTALAWSALDGLFSASEDKYIINWDVANNTVKSKWKAGKNKITAIAVLSAGKSILTADRIIKWWDLSTKKVIQTFTGHTNQISSLNCIKLGNGTFHLISSSTYDSFLSVWSLNETTNENTLVSSLLTQDEPVNVSVNVYNKDEITVLTTTKVGQAHLFKYQPTELATKSLKANLTVMVLNDTNKLQKIPILISSLTVDAKMILAYGSYNNINFEKISPDFSDTTQCLIRNKFKERKEDAITKMKALDTDSKVDYILSGTPTIGTKRNKSSTGSQLPLKDRLDNLSLGDKNISDKISHTNNESMVHLLIQSLQSKEHNILEKVLLNKNQNIISSTVSKLPVQVILPLIKELTIMVQGKTYPSKIATMWLKSLITTHAGQLMSHPDTVDTLTPILNFIDTKTKLMTEISKLRGRVNLITGQISNAQEHNREEEEALVVYQDSDSSADETDIGEFESESESDNVWEELSNLGNSEDENYKSDDNVSLCI